MLAATFIRFLASNTSPLRSVNRQKRAGLISALVLHTLPLKSLNNLTRFEKTQVSIMQKPNTLLVIVAVLVLLLFLPAGTLGFLVGTVFSIFKAVAVILAIIILVVWFTKRKQS